MPPDLHDQIHLKLTGIDWRLQEVIALISEVDCSQVAKGVHAELTGLKQHLEHIRNQQSKTAVFVEEHLLVIRKAAARVSDLTRACGHTECLSIATHVQELILSLARVTKEIQGSRIEICRLDPIKPPQLAELVKLLKNGVDSGAQLGFQRPPNPRSCKRYWEGIAEEVGRGTIRLLVARTTAGALVGSVQLALCTRPSGLHRVEVRKLLVHTDFRRRGIGRSLLEAAAEDTRFLGRTLLVLDTLKGDISGHICRRTGWIRVGTIPAYMREATGDCHDAEFFYRQL